MEQWRRPVPHRRDDGRRPAGHGRSRLLSMPPKRSSRSAAAGRARPSARAAVAAAAAAEQVQDGRARRPHGGGSTVGGSASLRGDVSRTAGSDQQPTAAYTTATADSTTKHQSDGRWTPLPSVESGGASAMSRAAVGAVGIDVACAAVARCCGVESLGYPTREHVMAAIHTLEVPGSTELRDRLGNGRASAQLLSSVEEVLACELGSASERQKRRQRENTDNTAHRRVQENIPPSGPGERKTAQSRRATRVSSADRESPTQRLESVDRVLEAVEREMSLSPVSPRDDDEGWRLPRGEEWELSSSSSSSSSSDGGTYSGRLPQLLEDDDAENEDFEEDNNPEQAGADAKVEQAIEQTLLPSSSQQHRGRIDESPREKADSGSDNAEKGGSSSRRTRSLHLVPRSASDRPGLTSYDPEPTTPPPKKITTIDDMDEGHESASPSSNLTRAASDGDVDKVMELLRQGADVDERDLGGWTALHWAANLDKADVTELLVSGGQADVNKVDRRGRTALITAAMSGSTRVLQLLLDKGARWERVDHDGKTALDWAHGTGESARILRKWEAEYGQYSSSTSTRDRPLRQQRPKSTEGGAVEMAKTAKQHQRQVRDAQDRHANGKTRPAGCLLMAIVLLTLLLCMDKAMRWAAGSSNGDGGLRNNRLDDGASQPFPATSSLLQSACIQTATAVDGAVNEDAVTLQLWRCLRGAEQQALTELAQRAGHSSGIWSAWRHWM